MSTKIYDGLRIRNVKSLKDFKDKIVNPFYVKCNEMIDNKIKTLLALKICCSIDELSIDIIPKEFYNFIGELKEINEKHLNKCNIISLEMSNIRGRFKKINKTMERDPLYDFEVKLYIYPYNHSTYFLLLRTEDINILNYFKSINGIEEYPYWNNTDEPEDVSRQ